MSTPTYNDISIYWKPLFLPLALVAIWFAISCFAPSFSPLGVTPDQLLSALATDIGNGSLPGAVLATTIRAVSGFLLGSACGFVTGLLIGLYRPAKLVLSPTLDSARQIALFAWIPLLSAWLGNGEVMMVTLIALGAFFPTALATAVGCANVPEPLLEVGRVLELNRRTEFTKIRLPAAAPEILAGLELSFNISWLGAIAAEYLIGTGYINGFGNGLGAYLAQAREFAHMDRILIGVLALGLSGFALDRSIAAASRRILAW